MVSDRAEALWKWDPSGSSRYFCLEHLCPGSQALDPHPTSSWYYQEVRPRQKADEKGRRWWGNSLFWFHTAKAQIGRKPQRWQTAADNWVHSIPRWDYVCSRRLVARRLESRQHFRNHGKCVQQRKFWACLGPDSKRKEKISLPLVIITA